MINVLDCTLRDGGYINNWTFGNKNIHIITKALSDSGVDFIELGYLSDKGTYSNNETQQSNIMNFSQFIKDKSKKHLLMVNFGDFAIENIPNKDKTDIDGIRVAFKKQDRVQALKYCEALKNKGYLVFVQPMVSMSYSDEEFKEMIETTNKIEPFAFYVVDSFGEMTDKDFLHYYNLAESNLKSNINIGFHSHNNLQLSFSNSKLFAESNSKHNIIIDSSVYGMGRGAGNLNTEIIINYLNNNFNKNYNLNAIVDVIDKIIYEIHENHYWGYSIPYYLAAKNHCHPNYASYLDQKKTLLFLDIENILKSIPNENKTSFSKSLVEELYKNFQSNKIVKNNLTSSMNEDIAIVVAPGSSAKNNTNKISSFIKKYNPIVFSINHIPDDIKPNYLFISNRKRMSELELENVECPIISTSNLGLSDENMIIVDYDSLCDKNFEQIDNAGMMLLRLLIKLGIKKAYLAGFDGYKYEIKDAFKINPNKNVMDHEFIEKKNQDIINQLNKLQEQIDIISLTPTLYNLESIDKQKS